MFLLDLNFQLFFFFQSTAGKSRKLAVTWLIFDFEEELNMKDVVRVVKVCPSLNTLTIDSPEKIQHNLGLFVGVSFFCSYMSNFSSPMNFTTFPNVTVCDDNPLCSK